MTRAAACILTALATVGCSDGDKAIQEDATGCRALPSVVYEDANPGLDARQLDYVMNVTASRIDCLHDIERDLVSQIEPEARLQYKLYAAEAQAAEAALDRMKIWHPTWTKPVPLELKP